MNRGRPWSEFDLFAYADGRFDHDPAKKAEIERRLRERPEDAARAHAYRAQTEALRRYYGPRIMTPVPERFYRILERRPASPLRTAARAAAALVVLISAAAGGWLAGHRDLPDSWSARVFVDQSYRDYVASEREPLLGRIVGADEAEPMNWLVERISLSLNAPDLKELGYAITDKQTVSTGDDQMVRLTYAASDGRSFALFLRPRWQQHGPELKLAREGDVTLAYWLDGPLASAVASRLPPGETLRIAEAVRREMHNPATLAPAVEPAPPLSTRREAGIAGDGLIPDGVVVPVPKTRPASSAGATN